MIDNQGSPHAATWQARLIAKLTRRHMLAVAGAVGVASLASHAPALRAAAQAEPNVRDAVNALITVEAFAVTFYGVARDGDTNLELTDELTRFVRSAQCGEEAHFHFFESAGGAPTTTTFTIDPAEIADQPSFLASAIAIEELLVAAHMSAARAFAAAGETELVEIVYQIGAVEAQHLALLRQFSGERTPANRAFAAWGFRSPVGALETLAALAYIDGNGAAVSYPGPVDRFCRGMFGLVPETTANAPDLDNQRLTTPAATPEA